jgi:hypothetical protein
MDLKAGCGGERGSASLDCPQGKSCGVGSSGGNFQAMHSRFRIAWVKEGLALSLQSKRPTATLVAPRLGAGCQSLAHHLCSLLSFVEKATRSAIL